jgi:exonuclease SbcC
MILARVTLRPFAGMALREIELSPRLNLVLGPNEAGKTTVFQAIQAALFTRTDLPPAKFERELRRFIPVGSGDTASVVLEFAADNGTYVLKKRWGASAPSAARASAGGAARGPAAGGRQVSGRAASGSTELLFPDGSVLTNEEEVGAEIERLIGVREGTCRSVLMSSQAGLTRTLEDLQGSDEDTLHSLGDVLRRSILETDGISVDRFRSLIEEARKRYWSRWDAASDGPEKGRGIANPYTTKVGLVLEAYYKKETLSAAHAGAREHEEKLDAMNRELARLSHASSANGKYLAENREAVEAARERRDARLELEAAGSRAGGLREANERWPVVKNRVEENRARIAALESRAAALDLELERAQREISAETSRAAFDRVAALGERLEQRKGELGKLKALTRDDLEALRNAHAAVEKTRALNAAGGLRIRFHAKKETRLEVDADGEPRVGREVKAGESLELEARGRARFGNPDWELEARLVARAGETEQEPPGETLSGLYARLGVGSLKEASDANLAYEEALHALGEAEESLKRELGGRSFGDIEAERSALGEPAGARPLAAITGDLANTRGESARLAAEAQAAEKEGAELARRYGDQSRLLLLVAENVRRVTELEERLAGLPPLPGGDEGELIAAFEKRKKEQDDLKDRVQGLMLEVARLEGRAPELSSEELGEQLAEAATAYERVRARGTAISRIRDLSAAILGEVDRATYDDMRRRLEELVASLTGGRYTSVRMRESIPEGFLIRGGAVLEYALMSTGTKDVLALALRLAMAGYFLEGRDGFVIMDDPFANLDPDRQKRAAEAVLSFSETRQLILFSCHPSAAELLGVAPILL